ncbi:MAG: sulfotransferase [Acidobacteriota bacterium]|nr:sulfotransferase [Acidobacteriota bacterium]
MKPLGVRLIDLATGLLGNLPIRRMPLRVEPLLDRAVGNTGLDDFGDPAFREPLTRLVDGMREEGRLTPMGRLAAHGLILGALVERLKIVDEVKRAPDLASPSFQPLVVAGLYRSGTTFLHHLLGAMPSVHGPTFGELRSPVRASQVGGREEAIRIARRVVKIHRYLSPGADTIHPIAADEPDECLHLLENSFWTTTSTFISDSTSFAKWIGENDAGPAYRFYRSQLGLLARRVETERWALKWPMHLWWLDTLLETLPRARVVVLERDPARVVPSTCSLNVCTRTSFSPVDDPHRLGAFWLDYLARGRERQERVLATASPDRIRRLDYEAFVANPISTVQDLADWMGWALSDEDRQAVRARVGKPRYRGKPSATHRYTAEDYGLTDGGIRERMGWSAR